MSQSSLPLTCVINVRNGEKYIEETLRSILVQKIAVTTLVVDNHSTDSTAQIVAKYPQVTRVLTPNPLPLGASRNFSLELVKTRFVTWLDADDLWATDFSENYHKAFCDNPQAVIFSSGTTLIDEQGNELGFFKQRLRSATNPKPYIPGDSYKDILTRYRHRYAWCSYVFDTDAVRRAGGMDCNFHYAEDFDLIVKVLQFGKAIHIPKNLTLYRIHPNQATHLLDPKTRWEETYQVMVKASVLSGQNVYHSQSLKNICNFKIACSRFLNEASFKSLGPALMALLLPGVLPWLTRRVLIDHRLQYWIPELWHRLRLPVLKPVN